MSIAEQVHAFVKAECEKPSNTYGMSPYHHHFLPVVKYAKELARKRGADLEVVEIAAWLHDIGSIQGHYEDHHLAGAKTAEELLRKLCYPREKIEAVKHCILSHRGSKNIPRETVEAQCLCDADAMAHLDTLGGLFRLAYVTYKMSEEEAIPFVRGKLKQSYAKLSSDAKTLVKSKYDAAMLLLE